MDGKSATPEIRIVRNARWNEIAHIIVNLFRWTDWQRFFWGVLEPQRPGSRAFNFARHQLIVFFSVDRFPNLQTQRNGIKPDLSGFQWNRIAILVNNADWA